MIRIPVNQPVQRKVIRVLFVFSCHHFFYFWNTPYVFSTPSFDFLKNQLSPRVYIQLHVRIFNTFVSKRFDLFVGNGKQWHFESSN